MKIFYIFSLKLKSKVVGQLAPFPTPTYIVPLGASRGVTTSLYHSFKTMFTINYIKN